MAELTHAAQMLAKIEAAMLANPAGVGTVTVDGEVVTYTQLEKSYDYWRRQIEIEAGTRPRSGRINLGGF